MAAPPPWIASLTKEVADQLHALDVLAPLGCHVYHNRARDEWEISLFVATTEIVGGPYDGQQRPSGFQLDVEGLRRLFEEVRQLTWQSHTASPEDQLGPHLSLEGRYAGRTVWLRILAESPDRYEPGRRAIAYEHRLEDLW